LQGFTQTLMGQFVEAGVRLHKPVPQGKNGYGIFWATNKFAREFICKKV
jgi:hypothetical protein